MERAFNVGERSTRAGGRLANPFLIVNDVAEGHLEVMTSSSQKQTDVEISTYVFSCRTDALERAPLRKFRE